MDTNQDQIKKTEPEAPKEVIQTQTTAVVPQENPYSVDVREIKTSYFDPVVWKQMKGMAESFRASGALPQEDNTARLLMKIQAGYEMGMKPIESIKSFYFVKGTINIFGAAVIRRLREHGWTIEYKDEPNKCTATITKGAEKHKDTFTFEEAEKSGWTKGLNGLKPGWYEGANRKLKLRYGVTSLLVKTYVPEVLGSAVDIAEVAMDTVPVIEGSKTVSQLPNGGDPADEQQIKTIKQLGGEAFEIPDGMTKQEAAETIKALATAKKGANHGTGKTA